MKDIVKKRRDFEYKLHRRAPQKVDFLRAISFELNLEALRKLRKKRMGKGSACWPYTVPLQFLHCNATQCPGIKKSKASDNAIVHRIIVLFTRAVRKFRGDSRLWLQFIDFGLRTNSSRLLTRIMPRYCPIPTSVLPSPPYVVQTPSRAASPCTESFNCTRETQLFGF